MSLTFYDSSGKPVAYTEDGTHIYLFSGEPVAYLDNESVYSFSGKHLVQFHKVNLNMLFGPWTDSLPVVGDRVKKCAQTGYLCGF